MHEQDSAINTGSDGKRVICKFCILPHDKAVAHETTRIFCVLSRQINYYSLDVKSNCQGIFDYRFKKSLGKIHDSTQKSFEKVADFPF